MKLNFGNHEALVEAIKRIGTRTGWFGDTFAEGTKRAAEIIGGDAYKYANHIKGMELPGYDLRTLTDCCFRLFCFVPWSLPPKVWSLFA